ncbi:MAG: hypothetical protein KIT79_12605 [Deltaproteobacteria bacterium]|nr:hypothetical protein [Deltaproteobacteria bacterium]
MSEETSTGEALKSAPPHVLEHHKRDGQVILIPVDGVNLWFRVPQEADVERFMDEAAKKPSLATKNLAAALCLSHTEYGECRKKSPVMFLKVAGTLLDLTGLNGDLAGKKV